MPLPWLRLLNTALNITDAVQASRARARDAQALTAPQPQRTSIESRLAGVVVASLREAFDRDSQRREQERLHQEEERRRAERLLRLELLRQAGEREIGRQRLVMGAAALGWVGVVLAAMRVAASLPGRVTVAGGACLLVAALACALLEQGRLARNVAGGDDRLSIDTLTSPGVAGVMAPWLTVVGYLIVALAALFA